ncbi:MAG: DUF368 domain-containing protein [Clostridiales bacterium]|nr:DUF368 domain-containing protein [Clostridiales bacterium]
MKGKKRPLLLLLLWFIEGMLVGFGAILPGISGGTLCVAFGMYKPLIETLSNVRSGLKKHALMLVTFLLGVLAGFVALSGAAAIMLQQNTDLVTCLFIGFIIGTFPDLWRDAGAQGRTKRSVIALLIGFAGMIILLGILKSNTSLSIEPGIPGFFLSGVLWGMSFIVPGLSSSSLLLFFGLYQPMLMGIASFDMSVLIPMGLGMGLCVLLLSKIIGKTFENHYSASSHGILGIVAATAVMILPEWDGKLISIIVNIAAIILGGGLSFIFSGVCRRIKRNA